MSCQFKSDEKTQRHKDTEARNKEPWLRAFVPLCFSRRLLLLVRHFEPHDV
jgi:hypothetical protein